MRSQICSGEMQKRSISELFTESAPLVWGQDLNVSRKEAEHFINQYFETYPAIKTYLDGLVDFAKTSGYAKTMFGRRRPVPELSSGNFYAEILWGACSNEFTDSGNGSGSD